MKNLLIIFIVFGWTSEVYAQTGNIKGIINTSDNHPASFVNVYLEGTNKGTTTDQQGKYELRNVKEGSYLLVTSYVGLKKQEVNVSVREGETTVVPPVFLEIGSEELQEVVVQGEKPNRFAETKSDYVAKLPLKNIENPQSYSTISSELLKEQVITNFDDALKNAPGITRLWESTGRGGDGAGYYSLRGFAVQPTMVNGLPGLTNGGLDPANIERIEVIKGPSGTLYGSSLISYGGLINLATKKPYESFGGEISYITGSFGLNRITADVNTPLDAHKNALFRLNGAYHSENSFQDAGFRESFFVAPSLSYQVNDKLSFFVVTEFLESEGTNQTMLFLDRGASLTVNNMKELGYDHNRSYTSNNLSIRNPTFNLQAQMNYQLSNAWRSQTAISRSSSRSEGYYSYLYESSRFYDIDGSVFGRYISLQNSATLTTDIQQNFTGDFSLGSLRNRMVVGIDYFHNSTTNNSTGYVGNGAVYIGNAGLQAVNEQVFGITEEASYIRNNDSGVLSRAATDALLANTTVSAGFAEQQIYSAYISDVINFTPALSAMASLRVDHFVDKEDDSNNQTALSPKFGVVYQLLQERISLFGNYMNGFSNVAPRAQGDGQVITTFDPEQANQWEIGLKASMMDGKVTSTISYYDIKVSDVVRQDPERGNDPESPEFGQVFYVQDGENYSKGFEVDVIANPVSGFNIVAGYSYNDSEIGNTNPEYNGRRPESAGSKHLVNAWMSYRFPQGTLKGFGLGFGANYASEFSTLDRVTTGTFTLPEYTVLNATVFYNAEHFRLALKLDNLTNEEYYKGWSTINPQKTRSISAGLTYRF